MGKASHTNGSPPAGHWPTPGKKGGQSAWIRGQELGVLGQQGRGCGVAVIATVVLVVACSLCILVVFRGDRLLRLFPAKADPGHGWEGEGVIRV